MLLGKKGGRVVCRKAGRCMAKERAERRGEGVRGDLIIMQLAC